ncbi:MAG: FAD-binding oxidoreductase, partial [Alphaproteobacteria bacterium]
MLTLPQAFVDDVKGLVGPNGLITGAADSTPYLREWRDKYEGETPLIVRPGTSEEVSHVLRLCTEYRIPITPQGGNTGLVGGQIPFGTSILLSLTRLNRIRALDAANDTITVEAGVILAEIQAAAEQADRFFPLSLAAEGSCRIGGNLSTNAGGVNVLRYGNTRDQVLGLEVVLADGRVWDGLRGLRKDNTGYDLKHLFIGAEGTLGVITAATLKLRPRPRQSVTAFIGLVNAAQAVALLGRARSITGDLVSSFELIPAIGLDFVLRHGPNTRAPLEGKHPWMV